VGVGEGVWLQVLVGVGELVGVWVKVGRIRVEVLVGLQVGVKEKVEAGDGKEDAVQVTVRTLSAQVVQGPLFGLQPKENSRIPRSPRATA